MWQPGHGPLCTHGSTERAKVPERAKLVARKTRNADNVYYVKYRFQVSHNETRQRGVLKLLPRAPIVGTSVA
jgi:hypothetical protein